MEVCILCERDFDNEPAVQVREKGLKTLIRISAERQLHELSRYF